MSIVLRPLVNLAGSLLDRLWQIRLRKPVGVLLPDWADPFLPDPVGPDADADELELRARIGVLAGRLRSLDPVNAAREILRGGGNDPHRLAALLALPGCAPWAAAGPATMRRTGADGAIYTLHAVPGEGAPHAEYAVVTLAQCLQIQPGVTLHETAGVICLSLACALRDMAVLLGVAGEPVLADEVACAGGLSPMLLPGLKRVAMRPVARAAA